MLVEPLIFAVMLGWILKGKVTRLLNLALKGLSLPIIAALIELVLYRASDVIVWSPILTLLAQMVIYGALLTFFYLNRQVLGLRVVGFGVLLNAIVIFANGGLMPVDTTMALEHGFNETLTLLENGSIFGHAVMGTETIFWPLADWIQIGPPYPFPKTVSFGDLVMDLGFCITIVNGMLEG